MNKSNLIFAALSIIIVLSSCIKDDCTRVVTYTKYEPIYKTYEEIRVDPVVEPGREIKKPGKIYLFGSMILLNEIDEGVHIIDNANPSNPVNLAFISIPGNIDIAMNGYTLYADNYIDLLAIDISDIQNIRLTKRVEDVFPNFGVNSKGGILVKYKGHEVTEKVTCDKAMLLETTDANRGQMEDNNFGGVSASSGSGPREVIGKGGSLARFAVVGQHLYVVDDKDMHIYDISTAQNPNKINKIQIGLGWGIETIFPYEDKLFIGSNTGLFIYDNSNPNNPTYLSEFEHAEVCDPVFVDGDYAYVTLRTGTECDGFINQLDVIDISDISNPFLVSSTDMINPHGLSIEEDKLYLCDGKDGLKVFDVADKMNIGQNLLFHDVSIATYDVITIPQANILLVIGEDGFYQYNTTSPSNLQLLSHISVVK